MHLDARHGGVARLRQALDERRPQVGARHVVVAQQERAREVVLGAARRAAHVDPAHAERAHHRQHPRRCSGRGIASSRSTSPPPPPRPPARAARSPLARHRARRRPPASSARFALARTTRAGMPARTVAPDSVPRMSRTFPHAASPRRQTRATGRPPASTTSERASQQPCCSGRRRATRESRARADGGGARGGWLRATTIDAISLIEHGAPALPMSRAHGISILSIVPGAILRTRSCFRPKNPRPDGGANRIEIFTKRSRAHVQARCPTA